MRKLLRDRIRILQSCGRRRLFWQDANSKYEKRARSDCKRCNARWEVAKWSIQSKCEKSKIDKTLMRRLHFVIRIPQRRKLRRKESSTCQVTELFDRR